MYSNRLLKSHFSEAPQPLWFPQAHSQDPLDLPRLPAADLIVQCPTIDAEDLE